MKELQRTGFAERLKTAAEARKALLADFRPKPAVTDPNFEGRAALQAARLQEVRSDRAEAKIAKKQAAVDAEALAQQALDEAVVGTLQLQRGERKERKALSKAEAKAKRDARYAARKARK